MNNPDLAIFLYIAIVAMQVLFSKRWADFYKAVASASQSKVSSTSAGSTQTSTGSQHGL